MKKKFKLLILFILVFCLASCSSKTKTVDPIPFKNKITQYENSVGYVLSYDRTGRVLTGYSSSFVYSKNEEATFVVTGNRIIKPDYTYKIVIDDTVMDATYIGSDSKLNLAVLSFDSSKYDASPLKNIETDNIMVGNTIYVSMLARYSSKLENNLSISEGIISSKEATLCSSDYLYNCNNYFLVDNVSYDSSIGAPMFDYYGNLVGVVSYVGYKESNNVFSYVSRVEDVKFSIDNILKGNKFSKGDLHVNVKSYEDLKVEEKALVKLTNIKSTDVIITSTTGASKSSGVELNSRIVSIDSKEINNKTDLVEVISEYMKDDTVKLKIEIEDNVYKTYSIRL